VKEDPVISSGVLKVVLAVIAAGVLGIAAFAFAADRIDIDLPDLPEVDTVGDGTPTNLENTTIEEGNLSGAPTLELFTTAGFAQALDQVKAEVGSGRELTRLFINDVQTQFIVRSGDGVEALSVRADTGELHRNDATITISGSAEISDFAFPLDGVDPAAIDRMLTAVERESGDDDLRPTVLSLERGIPFGRRALEWTINAQAGGRYLLYRAAADGTKVRNEGGEGTPIPPAAAEAQELSDCIQGAGSDPEKILACIERLE
jgi:hypothetical protein